MNLRRSIGLLLAACASAGAVAADVKGVSTPSFTDEELKLVNRDARLIDAASSCPEDLRRALDAWQQIQRAAPQAPTEAVPCTQAGDDMGRASAEAAHDLLQLLKEAAGKGTNQ